MKEIKRFKEGDQIPENAKFICTATEVEKYSQRQSGTNAIVHNKRDVRVFLYEVKIPTRKKQSLTKDQVKEISQDVVSYLNKMTGKNFRPFTNETMDLIRGLSNRGFTKIDMVHAIDNMVLQWGDDPKMKVYLRPSTLFRASKFENYLNTKAPGQEAADAFKDLEDYC